MTRGFQVLVLLALCGVACSCVAGGDDAGIDAAVDARDAPDAPREDAPRDTPRDAPEIVVPGFVRVGTDVLPSDCDLRMATDPMTTHGGPLTFVPCPDRTGCRQIDVNWTSLANPTFEVGRFQSEHDGVRGRFAYTRLAPESTGDFVDWNIIADDAGEIEALIRSPRLQCQAGWPAISDGRYATIAYYRNRRAERLGEYVVGGELSDPVGTFQVLAFLDAASTPVAVADIAVDSTGVALTLAGGTTIVRVDWEGSVQRVASPATEDADAAADFIRDGSVVFTASRGGLEVRAVSDAGTVPLIPRTAEGHPALPSTDGVDLVWMRGVGWLGGRSYEQMELWTSPYCLLPACLSPRMVTAVEAPGHQPIRVGFGMAGYGVASTSIEFTELATGVVHHVDLPAGRRWLRTPPFIGPDEVAVVPSIDRFPDSPFEAETVMFIRRDSL